MDVVLMEKQIPPPFDFAQGYGMTDEKKNADSLRE
jgi:hypothetical protein